MGVPTAAVRLSAARLVGVGLVVFAANAALMVLQLVAGKLLAPFVGSSLETWTSVIGVFLAGIALGNGFGGRLADRHPSPRTLAALLAVGAVAALWMVAFPLVLEATGLHRSVPLGPRIPLLALPLCFPAGLVLSLLTPLAIKLGLPDVRRAGRTAGMVFALGTLGCLVGNYLTGFYLIPSFTLNGIVLACAGVLTLLAAGAALMGRAPTGEAEPDEAAPAPADAKPEPPPAFPDLRRALAVVFLASFGGMTLELAASRLLAQFLGVSLYTWTGIIGVMLAGTACGNFLGGQLADRLARHFPGGRVGRAVLSSLLLAAAAATVALFVTLAVLTQLHAFAHAGLVGQVLGWTFALFFPPMLALGTVSPQVVRLCVPDVGHAGAIAGRVYGWSTAGAIAGTFATGYVLLPGLGVHWTVLLVSLTFVGAALLVSRVWESNAGLYLLSTVLGGVAGGFILTVRGLVSLEPDRPGGMIAVRNTNYYTIKVSRDRDRPWTLGLYLDHLLHSVVDPGRPTYLFYEHEGVQLEVLRDLRTRTDAPKVLVIGGGGYTFPRCARALLPEAGVDVVEIDSGVTRAAVDFLGFDPASGVRSFHMDGRQFVSERAAPGEYDLIALDAVNDYSVPGHLTTREFNDAAKRCLAPGGVYLLTVIDGVTDGKLWTAAVHTLRQSFPHVALLGTGPDWEEARRHVFVIYASNRPLDVGAFERDAARRLDAARAPIAAALDAALGGWAHAGEPRVYARPAPAGWVESAMPLDPVLLTDQYAPVDNLMAEVFRKRGKEQAEE